MNFMRRGVFCGFVAVREAFMIRLSCWVGAKGCAAPGGSPDGGEHDLLSVLQPVARFVEHDAAGDGHPGWPVFADASLRLARCLQTARPSGPSSLDELLRCMHARQDGPGEPGTGHPQAAPGSQHPDRSRQAECLAGF